MPAASKPHVSPRRHGAAPLDLTSATPAVVSTVHWMRWPICDEQVTRLAAWPPDGGAAWLPEAAAGACSSALGVPEALCGACPEGWSVAAAAAVPSAVTTSSSGGVANAGEPGTRNQKEM